MKRLMWLVVAVMSLAWAKPGSTKEAAPDTLVITLPQGDWGASLDQKKLRNNISLQRLIDEANHVPNTYIAVELWRSSVTWKAAGKSQRHSGALDGGVTVRTEMFVTEMLTNAGLANAEHKVAFSYHCYKPQPTVVIYLSYVETRDATRDTTVVIHETREIVHERAIDGIASKLRLGAGLTSTPFNGAGTLNVEMRFDRSLGIEFTLGHSLGLFAQDRTIEGAERSTNDQVIAAKLIMFPSEYVGAHVGFGVYENTITNGPFGERHIMQHKAVLLGPSVRYDRLQLNASLAYGPYDVWDRDLRWQARAIVEGVFYFWR